MVFLTFQAPTLADWNIEQGLTWLPSRLQKIAGWGFPVASHWKVTVRPKATTWSRGFTTKCGGSKGDETNYTKSKHVVIILMETICWYPKCCHYFTWLIMHYNMYPFSSLIYSKLKCYSKLKGIFIEENRDFLWSSFLFFYWLTF